MKSTELKKEVKECKKKEKKLYTIWSKIGSLFGFNKDDLINETIEEKEKLKEAEETATQEDVTTEPKVEEKEQEDDEQY